jgi:flagellar biosynthesis protein FlhF
MNDAIRLVKKELGKDAVILSTREKETLAGEGGKPLRVVEVVAASAASLRQEEGAGQRTARSVEAPAARMHAGRGLQSQPSSHSAGTVHAPGRDTGARPVQFPRIGGPSETTVVKGSPTLSTHSAGTRKGSEASSPAPSSAPATASASAAVRERLLATDPGAFTPAPRRAPESPAGPGARAGNEVRELREELTRMRRDLEVLPQVDVGEQMQEIKVLLHDLMRNRSREEEGRFHEYLTDISVRLRAAGVREAIITETLQTVAGVDLPRSQEGLPSSGAKLREFYLSQTIKALFRKLTVTGPWRFDAGRPAVICLVGPTGVGKTTTIAKLAARYKLTDGKRVALASMDTFRIGGADQLRVYSKILDCPFAEISEPDDLVEFAARTHDAQVILVDTAGRSARHEAQMRGLAELSGIEIPLAFHLVLAATMKQRDLDENLKAYKAVSPESLIFTKLDESWSYGEILNCSVGGRLALSYFTTGQKVPEDLEAATKERVVERLFRL